MNPFSMETIFTVLSGVILFAGILYWLWSHIQLTQKKVQLLENAVFELRGMLSNVDRGGPDHSIANASSAPAVPQQRTSPYKDLDDDDWDEPERKEGAVEPVSTPIETLNGDVAASPSGSTKLEDLGITYTAAPSEVSVEREDHEENEGHEEVSDDLMPGGRIYAPEESAPVDAQQMERFRELFTQPETGGPSTPASRTSESLEGMPVAELRRLAIQRGINGARDMRKKEILAALREQVAAKPTPMPVPEEEAKEINIADIIKGVEVKEVVQGDNEGEATEAEILE
jgi:hypothetical protein